METHMLNGRTPADAEERARVIENALHFDLEWFADLYSRWLDEREYEDFKDYAKVMEERFGLRFVRATERPFGCVIRVKRIPYYVHIEGRAGAVSWRSGKAIK